MAIARAASHSLLPATFRALLRAPSQVRSGAPLLSHLFSSLQGVEAVEQLPFARELLDYNVRRSHSAVRAGAAQKSIEAAPVPPEYEMKEPQMLVERSRFYFLNGKYQERKYQLGLAGLGAGFMSVKELLDHNVRRIHSAVRAGAAQKNIEAAPVPPEYQTFVDKVKARLETERADLPVGKNGRDDEDLLLWFLRDRNFDVDAAVAKLIEVLEWRREFGVDEITEASISRVASIGEAYLHSSPAKDGRPVIIVISTKHFPNDELLIESQKHCVYLIEKALKQLPPGGETFLGIFDLRGFEEKNGDLKFVMFLIDVFFKYYPKRLGQVLLVDAPFIFQPGWRIMKPLFGKYAALVRFCSADDVRNEYFTPDTIPGTFKQ